MTEVKMQYDRRDGDEDLHQGNNAEHGTRPRYLVAFSTSAARAYRSLDRPCQPLAMYHWRKMPAWLPS